MIIKYTWPITGKVQLIPNNNVIVITQEIKTCVKYHKERLKSLIEMERTTCQTVDIFKR